jgi:hypothetical protein
MPKTKDEELLETMCSSVHDLKRWSELTPKGATEYLLHFAHVMEAGVAAIEELQLELDEYKHEIYDLRNKMI